MTAIEKLIDQLDPEEIEKYYSKKWDSLENYPDKVFVFDTNEENGEIHIEFYPDDEHFSEGEFVEKVFVGYASTLCWHIYISKDFETWKDKMIELPAYPEIPTSILIDYMPILDAVLGGTSIFNSFNPYL
jgi:hypothetical protein